MYHFDFGGREIHEIAPLLFIDNSEDKPSLPVSPSSSFYCSEMGNFERFADLNDLRIVLNSAADRDMEPLKGMKHGQKMGLKKPLDGILDPEFVIRASSVTRLQR